MSELELDLSERLLILTAAGKYKLELRLPYPVLEDEAAKFDRQRKVLTVIVPVKREDPKELPPRPEEPVRVEQVAPAAPEVGKEEEVGTEAARGGPTLPPPPAPERHMEKKPAEEQHGRWVQGAEKGDGERLVVDQGTWSPWWGKG